MGCFFSRNTMSVTRTTTDSHSYTVGGERVTNVSSTSHTTPSRGKPTTTHNTYTTRERLSVPTTGDRVAVDGQPPATALEAFVHRTWAFDFLVNYLWWTQFENELLGLADFPSNPRPGKRKPWAAAFADGAITFSNGVTESARLPAVRIARLSAPKTARFGKKQVAPITWRWAWADLPGEQAGEQAEEKAVEKAVQADSASSPGPGSPSSSSDVMAIKRAGLAAGIPQLSTAEFALEQGDGSALLAGAMRVLGLHVLLEVPVQPGAARAKRPSATDLYLLRTDAAEFPLQHAAKAPALRQLDGNAIRFLRAAGRVLEHGEVTRAGAAGPQCFQGLADRMGWEVRELVFGSRVETVRFVDPRGGIEWDMYITASVDGPPFTRHNDMYIRYKHPVLEERYESSFTEA